MDRWRDEDVPTLRRSDFLTFVKRYVEDDWD
jgi:hypothetical protein